MHYEVLEGEWKNEFGSNLLDGAQINNCHGRSSAKQSMKVASSGDSRLVNGPKQLVYHETIESSSCALEFLAKILKGRK